MLNEEQVKKLKEHLDRAQNPVFFFDNDPDGLCSYLLLRRFYNKGKGVSVKSFPELHENYFRKVEELNADYIFILDKPIVSDAFLDEAEKHNVPVVWVDHHEVEGRKIPDFVDFFNPLDNPDSNGVGEPTTFLCYQITGKKEDLWIAVIGCISDSYLPDFYESFSDCYPELSVPAENAFDVFFKSEIGKIARMFSFGLKDRVTNVVNMTKFLVEVKTPHEVLLESKKNYSMHRRFEDINSRYKKLVEKAKSLANQDKLLFFQYGGTLSISADIANELIYLYPEKIVIVAYLSGIKANISARGKNVKQIFLKSIEGLEDASGGGHNDAIGGRVKIEDLEKFRDNFEVEIDGE